MSSTLALTMASVTQKILIVDDEPDIRDLLSHCLKKVGYSVDTAANGQDGIFAAIQFRPSFNYNGFDDAGDGRFRSM